MAPQMQTARTVEQDPAAEESAASQRVTAMLRGKAVSGVEVQ